jgi:tetratricopeptide (TPR) repeat protein
MSQEVKKGMVVVLWLIGHFLMAFGGEAATNAQLAVLQGLAALQCSQYDKAIRHFTVAIKADKCNVAAYVNRGNAYAKMGDYEKAIADYTEAIRIGPQVSEAYFNRASAYCKKGEYVKSVSDCNEAIRLNPRDGMAYYNRGIAREELEELEKAMEDYTAAIRLDPKFSDAYVNRGNLHCRLSHFDKAVLDYSEAIRLRPADAEGYYNRGLAHHNLMQYNESVKDFSKAVNVASENPIFSSRLAWELATCPDDRVRNGPKAVTFARKACELSKWSNPRYLKTLAAAHAENGDFELAVKWQEAALANKEYAAKYGIQGRELLSLYQKKSAYHEKPKP